MPTTTGRATDFITFSRTSNATVTDSNGFIKWAGHNLWPKSEQFDGWTTTATVIANAAVAPNSTTTADFLRDVASNQAHRVLQSVTTTGTPTTVAVFAKPNGRDWVYFRIDDASMNRFVWFNVSTGAVGTSQTGWTAQPPVSAGNGWYLLSATIAAPVIGANNAIIGVSNADAVETYTGNGTSGVYLWGAHLYRSDLGGMVLNPARGDAYYPTTPRNLLGYTEDFSNAAWPNLHLSVTTNSAVAPNGLQAADAIFETTTTGRHRFRQAISVAPASSTVSVYAKANGRDFISINIDDGNTQYAVFNLATGAVGVTGGGAVAHTPVSAGNGWWRCAVTFTSLSTNGPYIHLRDTNSQPADYAGDVTKGVYLWGAQLSDSASLDAYSPVYGAAVTSAAYYAPRLDFDPVTLAARGLLVEEQRTNLLLHSGDFSNASWQKNGCTFSAGVVTTTSTSDGLAQNLTNYVSNGTHSFTWRVSSGTATWLRITVYQAGGNRVSAWFNVATGAPGSATNAGTGTGATLSVKPVGTGVYDITLTGAVNNSATSVTAQISTAGADLDPVGVSGVTYGVQFAQLEPGSFATSYIPNGSAVAGATRTADVASVSTQAFPYSATEGTLVVGWAMIASRTGVGYPAAAQIDDGTNYVAIRQDGTADFRRYGVVQNGASTTAMLNVTAETLTAGTVLKAGLAYKANDFATTRGSTIGTASTGSVPSNLTTMRLGRNEASIYVNCWVRQVTYLPRRIANSELQARTV